MEGLANAAGHADRNVPLKNYCTGLLLPGERKSVEPMAARVAPDNVRRMHQSLHHLVADAPWSDDAILGQVRGYVLPAMKAKGSVQGWIVDDTGFPKKGSHSVGVARQYCGQMGKQDNCRVAVSLSVSTNTASLPIAFRLYLPEIWADDAERRRQAGVPEQIRFQTKPEIALAQIRQAVQDEVTPAPVLADAAYGIDSKFRTGLTELGLPYVVGVQSSTSVWAPGKGPLPAMRAKGPVQAWIVDDTGFPKKGSHSVGVARQYCGQIGKQDNCRVAVSLSVSTSTASLPIALRLYLPEVWANDAERRGQAGVPERIRFQTKPEIALDLIRQAVEDEVTPAPVLADAAYGIDSKFRTGLTGLRLSYVVGVQSSTSVWAPGQGPLPAKPWSGRGRPPRLLSRNKDHRPLSVRELALSVPRTDWKSVTWRAGARRPLQSRFARLRVRPAHRDHERAGCKPWLYVARVPRSSRASAK